MIKNKILLLLLLLFSTIVIAQQKKYVSYAVKKGETIKSIARDYDITTRDLLRLNPGVKRKPNAETVIIVPNKNFGKELKIITGNSDKMKEIVIEIIISYNLEYRIRDYINFGYIVVYS